MAKQSKQIFGKVHAHKNKRVDTSQATTYEELEALLIRNEALSEIPSGKKLKFGAGQRPVFSHPEQMAIALEQYFNSTPEGEWTLTGLALSCGLSYAGLMRYDKKDKAYYELLERAKLFVHNSYEKGLRKDGRTGDIFALKNLGWKDKQEVENTHKVVVMDSIKQVADSGEVEELTFNIGQTIEHEEQ